MRTIFITAIISLVMFSSDTSAADGKMALGVADTKEATTSNSVSALYSMNQDWIQALFALNQTKDNFDVSVGGAYKFTVAGNSRTGFHVGPGVSVGTIGDKFYFAMMGVAGGHHTFGESFMVAVDAGPIMTHRKDSTNFRLRPMGELLGASIHYLF